MKACFIKSKLLIVLVFTLTLSSFNFLLLAQDYSIKGIILDEKTRIPIDNAAIVFRTVDSTFLGTTLSNTKGEFTFDLTAKEGKLLLQVQHINYEIFSKLVSVKNNLEEILLSPKEQQLNEVVVKSTKPIIKMVDGNLRYNIQPLIENSSVSNAYDMLSRLPGIMKVGDNISLIGSQKYIIAINGKPMTLGMDQVKQILQGLPTDYVEAVDILYNAPPEYRINGAVINIILKNTNEEQSEEPTFQGNIYSNLSYHQKFGINPGLSLNYQKKGLNMYAFYNYKDQNNISSSQLYSKHKYLGNEVVLNQKTDIQVLRKSHNAYLDMSYTKGKSTIEVDYTLQVSPTINKTANSKNELNRSFNKKNSQTVLHNAELIYKYSDILKIGGDVTAYFDKGGQNLAINDANIDAFDFKQEVISYKIYTDLNHNLKNNWSIAYGASFTYSKDYNYQKQKLEILGSSSNIDAKTSESISTAYIKVAKVFSQSLFFDMSIVGEYSDFNKEKRFNIFPKFNLSYIPNMNHIVQVSLQSDKIYPAFWQKKPYAIMIDSYMQNLGNPNLSPYNEYTARINYIFKRKYVFSTYFTEQPRYFIQQAYQSDTEHKLTFQSHNWDYQRLFGVLGVIPFNITDRIQSSFTTNVFLTHVKQSKSQPLSFDRRKITAYFALNSTATLIKKFNLYLDASAFYIVNPIQGIYDLTNPFGLDLGLKWISKNKKFDVVLKCTDLFKTSTPKIRVDYQNQYFKIDNYEDTRGVILSLKYNFGNYKPKQNKNIDTSRLGVK